MGDGDVEQWIAQYEPDIVVLGWCANDYDRPFFVMDARAKYTVDEHWSAALGVDNLANRTYWNFHPYNQRTWSAEVRFDY